MSVSNHYSSLSRPWLRNPVSDEVSEAGGGRYFPDPGISYNITSVEQPDMNNRTQAVRIGCCVGGSSAINGMVAVRGTRSEYDGWAELGGEGSTWDWDGVIPYFRKVRQSLWGE